MGETNYKLLATKIVDLLGGKDNVKHALHCATRLRFNLKDFDSAKLEDIKQLDGVLGTMKVGEQFQVIIGKDVDNVFDEIAAILELDKKNTGELVVDDQKKKITFKSVGASILDALSGIMGPVIPAIVASAFFKMLVAILGPDMLNILSADSNLYILFTFVGDAAFYFFPCIVGYTSAKKFNVNPVLGILMGVILIHPTLINMVTEGNSFTVFGIPVYLSNYSGTIIPAILSVWVMSYVEKFFNKYIPASIRSVFAPAFTILVMLPLSLCILAPAGAFMGNYVVNGLLGLQGVFGFVGIAIIAALYPILVMTGMHMVLITAIFQIFAAQGWDGFATQAIFYASFSVMGVGIGAFFRLKNKEQKSLAAGYAITAIVAGTSEPTIYGICVRYKKPFLGLMAGGFVGGIYGGIAQVIVPTLIPSSNFTAILAFVGKSNGNLINGIIACVISLAVAAVITYLLGFEKKEPGLKL